MAALEEKQEEKPNYIPGGAPSNIPQNQTAASSDTARTEVTTAAKPGFIDKAKSKLKSAWNTVKTTASDLADKAAKQQDANAAAATAGHTTGGGTIDTNAEVLKDTDKGKNLVEAETKGMNTLEQTEEEKQANQAISPTKQEETPKQEDKTNVETEDDISQIESSTSETGIDPENEDPDVAKQQGQDLIEEMKKKGLINISEDGKISFAKLDTGNKPLIMKALTALSVAAAIATGGAIPPINVYKLSGAQEDEEMLRSQYTNMMNQYGSALGKVMAQQDTSRGISKKEQEEIGESSAVLAGDKYRDKLSTDSALQLQDNEAKNQLKLMNQGHANQTDMAKLLYEQGLHKDAERLAYMKSDPEFNKVLQDKKFLDDYAKMIRRTEGTAAADDFLRRAGSAVNTASTAVNTVTNAVKP